MAWLLFGSAGRWDVPAFWIYIAMWFVVGAQMTWKADLDLLKERMRPGPGGRDNLHLIRVFGALMLSSHLVIAGLDVGRYHWSDNVPLALQVSGLIGVALALFIMRWAQTVNRFFSAAMRIQRDRGHHVITSGPYRIVRHPGYFAFILIGICSGLALGSWLSVLPTLAFSLLFVRRAAREDRLLKEELEGYSDYAARVRYRLVPGVW